MPTRCSPTSGACRRWPGRTVRTRCDFRSTSRRRSRSGAPSSFARRCSRPTPRKSPQWNRGAYLVETLGHCNACHSRRNVFGATAGPLDLAGGLIPIQNWYAPSLKDNAEAGVGDWPRAGGRRAAEERRLGARLGAGADGRSRRAIDAVPERRRPRGDGGVPERPARRRRCAGPRDDRIDVVTAGRRGRRQALYGPLRGVPRRARRRRARRVSGRSPAIAQWR